MALRCLQPLGRVADGKELTVIAVSDFAILWRALESECSVAVTASTFPSWPRRSYKYFMAPFGADKLSTSPAYVLPLSADVEIGVGGAAFASPTELFVPVPALDDVSPSVLMRIASATPHFDRDASCISCSTGFDISASGRISGKQSTFWITFLDDADPEYFVFLIRSYGKRYVLTRYRIHRDAVGGAEKLECVFDSRTSPSLCDMPRAMAQASGLKAHIRGRSIYRKQEDGKWSKQPIDSIFASHEMLPMQFKTSMSFGEFAVFSCIRGDREFEVVVDWSTSRLSILKQTPRSQRPDAAPEDDAIPAGAGHIIAASQQGRVVILSERDLFMGFTGRTLPSLYEAARAKCHAMLSDEKQRLYLNDNVQTYDFNYFVNFCLSPR